MKVLVTGKNGFIAKNARDCLMDKKYEVLEVSHIDSDSKLEKYCQTCDFVLHLAAVQRADTYEEFYIGNVQYTNKIINYLNKYNNRCPIIFTTSTLVDKQESSFSKTKIQAEKLLRNHASSKNVKLYVFKLNHIFGKYGKPNFNSVISTYCYNTVNNLPLVVNNPGYEIEITYIDDLLEEFLHCIDNNISNSEYFYAKKQTFTLGKLAFYLGEIKNNTYNINDYYLNMLKKTCSYFERDNI